MRQGHKGLTYTFDNLFLCLNAPVKKLATPRQIRGEDNICKYIRAVSTCTN